MRTANWSNTAPIWSAATWRGFRDRQASGIRNEARALIKQVVAALFVRGQEILCCQRTEYQALPLKWEFPGGKIEAGEAPPEALARELEEELGVHAEIGSKVAQLQHTYLNGNAVELHFFKVEHRSQEHTSELQSLRH